MIVLHDDWLLHDLRGDNGPQRQEEAAELLKEVVRRCDRIAVPPPGSSWVKKVHDLASFEDPLRRSLSRLLYREVLWDLQKAIWAQGHVGLPTDLECRVPKDDEYLAQAYLETEADLLVSEDRKLLEGLRRCCIQTLCREDFLRDYLRRQDTKGQGEGSRR